ncbi:MAG: acetyl-CoA carboxylase biotin carboxyl carrier protein [Streptococcaceae bacterium]|nr:acetyl-CoA carboxylase biotin carboxyl carrier protein [Streptococcaceae bacterium]
MQINDVKGLMTQFDASSLREFAYQTDDFSLSFSKNNGVQAQAVAVTTPVAETPVLESTLSADQSASIEPTTELVTSHAEGEVVTSPLVGVAYLKPAPDKADFIKVGETVKKGQTLLIIEAMKVMNEIPAPHDGVVTEILVSAETMVEYGEALVRLK